MSTPITRSAPTLSRRGLTTTRASTFIDLSIVMGSTAIIAVIVRLVWPRFSFWGDNADSFLPLWHYVGGEIRQGRLPLFNHERWAAANLIGESAYGVLNPVTLMNAFAISFVDDLSVASFVVMVEFLAILSAGVYLLARTYAAGRSASMVAAIIVPFAGFTLFYGAGNWASGLMSIAWVVHFWWTARAYTVGRIGPGAALLTGGLAATVGNPFAVLGILVVLFALAVELLLARNPRRLMGLVAAGAVVGTVVLLVYLPLMGVLDQIDRPATQLVSNSNYLSPSLSDLLAFSSPGYLPRMNAWHQTSDLVPSTYLSWIVLPLLPWLNWASLRDWRPRASLFTAALVFALMTLGPEQVWLFRWPIRLVEYLFVAVAVIVALLLSTALASTYRRRRATLSAIALIATVAMAIASNPEDIIFHLLVGAVGVALAPIGIVLARKCGIRGILVVTIIGTAVLAPAQGVKFGWHQQAVGRDVDLDVAPLVSTVREASLIFEGAVLQIANIWTLPDQSTALAEGDLTFGHIANAAGTTSLNNYTGIEFLAFSKALATDYRGSLDTTFALNALLAPVSADYRAPLVDALGVSTLVIANEVAGAAALIDELPQWRVVDESVNRVVLVREEPLDEVHLTSDDVETRLVDRQGESLVVDVRSAQGGTLLVNRLGWHGYSAQVDGVSVAVSAGPAGLLEIEVPPGSGTLTLVYKIPNLDLGILIATLGAIAGLTHVIVWRRQLR